MPESIIGTIVLLLDLWAILSVISSSKPVSSKFGWTVFILILPVIGFLCWYISGPRAAEV
jgi:hypothetical protein